MPRPRTHTKDSLGHKALLRFWDAGYHATSIDDLVADIGVSKHALYSEFGGKRDLFLACFAQYQTLVVSPAFDRVEQPGADLGTVADYFEAQISLAEQVGLPGPGCFVANAAAEVAPHDAAVRDKVLAHNNRLLAGFHNALSNTVAAGENRGRANLDDLAAAMQVFAQGLWLQSRSTADGNALRRAVSSFLSSLEAILR